MGILDKDLAFSFPFMRRFQEQAIKAMEVAEETAIEQEASMRRLRAAVAELPSGVDTNSIDSALDRYQGKMVQPIYQDTKVYLKNRIDQLIENISAIDAEAGAKFEELRNRSMLLAWKCQSIVGMLGSEAMSLSNDEFQAGLDQVMSLEAGDIACDYLYIENGKVCYNFKAMYEELCERLGLNALAELSGAVVMTAEGFIGAAGAVINEWVQSGQVGSDQVLWLVRAVIEEKMIFTEPGDSRSDFEKFWLPDTVRWDYQERVDEYISWLYGEDEINWDSHEVYQIRLTVYNILADHEIRGNDIGELSNQKLNNRFIGAMQERVGDAEAIAMTLTMLGMDAVRGQLTKSYINKVSGANNKSVTSKTIKVGTKRYEVKTWNRGPHISGSKFSGGGDKGQSGVVVGKVFKSETNTKTYKVGKVGKGPGVSESKFGKGPGQLNTMTPTELSKLTPAQLKELLPEGWTYSGSPDGRFIHIKDANGNYRIRVDPADKVTQYPHMHILDDAGNSLDINGNIVPSNSPDGHIPR